MANKMMPKDREWLPDGVYVIRPPELTEPQKGHILEAAEAKGHERRDDFIRQIEIIIGSFIAEKEFLSKNTAVKVRNRLRKVEKCAVALMNAIEDVDEYGTQLLSRSGRSPTWSRPAVETLDDGTTQVGVHNEDVPGFTFYEASPAVAAIRYHVVAVLGQTTQYPKRRPKRLAHQHLTYHVGDALRDHLGVELTFNPAGRFGAVLVAVLACAGDEPKKNTDAATRDVSGLLNQAKIDLSS